MLVTRNGVRNARDKSSYSDVLCSLVLLGGSLLLIGCRTGPVGIVRAVADEAINAPGPLKVSIVERQVDQITEEGLRVKLMLKVNNPNRIDLPIRNVRYEIAYDKAIFKYQQDPRLTIGAGEEMFMPLVASFPRGNRKDAEISDKLIASHIVVSYEPPGEIRKLVTESGLPLPYVRVLDPEFELASKVSRHKQPNLTFGTGKRP